MPFCCLWMRPDVSIFVFMQAISDELRAQGNDKYTSIHDGLAPTIFASRLQTSIDLYSKVCAEPGAAPARHG